MSEQYSEINTDTLERVTEIFQGIRRLQSNTYHGIVISQ